MSHAPASLPFALVYRCFLPCLFLLLLLGGCRTYGGWGTETGLKAQMTAANERSEEALDRARRDFTLLQRAAATDAQLKGYAATYTQILSRHEAMLDAHRALASGLSESNAYRALSHAFSAILSENRELEQQYDGLLVGIMRLRKGMTPVDNEESRYVIAPPYYARLQHSLSAPTMQQALGS